jgi:primosomal protein N' (replication factor Y) (superfamily II helicase)
LHILPTDPMTLAPILRVAVAAPLYQTFDYLAPDGWDTATLRPGMRLRVPFGHGERCGLLLETADCALIETPLRYATAVLDTVPLLAPEDLALGRWAARYYGTPLGEVLLGTLPRRLRDGVPLPAPQGWQLTPVGFTVGDAQLRRAPRQHEIVEILRAHPGGVRLEAQQGGQSTTLRALAAKGWVQRCTVPAPSWAIAVATPLEHTLNAAQASALEALEAGLDGFHAYLLEGVTGSGKTEVYLRLLERALTLGRQALILVPEIALVSQLLRRMQRRSSVPIALLHSGLAEGERERAWLRARSGEARVVLGTRSAVFAPLPELGLIVVDEEHDSSYKQQEGFRYSARDLALVRARQRGCTVLLGSATPALETLRNVARGRYLHLGLPTRAGGAVPPRLALLNIRSVRLQAGLSPQLLDLMEERLGAGNQVLLFLNRRGYAPVLTCHDCGWVSGCRHCDARMTLHKAEQRLWCHHCGLQIAAPTRCPECASANLLGLGQGTEQLEEFLQERFPAYSLVRIDRDATRRSGALERGLAEIRSGAHRILLGTQMLAKGHHFPEVTLVGILDADQGLYSLNYRGSERMAQLLIQVAGRAGRAQKPGQVVIQTRHPDHPLLRVLIRHGYGAFARLALLEREQAELPPFSFQALLRAEAIDPQAPLAFLATAVALAHNLDDQGVEFWGPVPAPMGRLGGRTRAQLLLQSQHRDRLQALLGVWLPQLASLKGRGRIRWSIDVDPQEML